MSPFTLEGLGVSLSLLVLWLDEKESAQSKKLTPFASCYTFDELVHRFFLLLDAGDEF